MKRRVLAGLLLGLFALGQVLGSTMIVEIRHSHEGGEADHSHPFEEHHHSHHDGEGHHHSHHHGEAPLEDDHAPNEEENGHTPEPDQAPIHSHVISLAIDSTTTLMPACELPEVMALPESFLGTFEERCPESPFFEVMKPPQL